MSSAQSSTFPSSAELENLGVLFIGFVASTVLYGLTFFQTYIYYSRYPRDSKWMRYFVATLGILDTAASALISEVLYYYLIIMFDVNMDILYATTTFCVQYMLSVLLTFFSHLFFAHRIFQVTGGSRPVTLILIFFSFLSLVFGLTVTGQMYAQRRLSAFGSLDMEITTVISQAAGLVADIIVFATMCYSLRPARYTDIVVPRGITQIAVMLLVGRGFAFTMVQAAYLGIFIATPSRLFWVPLQMIACKVYVNTLLGHLNSRDVRHGQGLNEEDSLTDRKAPTNARLSNSVRLGVTDGKATTQSINLTTRQNDVESEVTELESRKTYQDEHGNYTQVSTTSSQSQADEASKVGLSEL